jgi:short-subunit dehydrogenase
MTASKEIIWITGASSGIGFEMARQYAALGHHIIASGRNVTALEKLKTNFKHFDILAFDICDEIEVSKAAQQLLTDYSHIDRVILNAGNCEYLDPGNPDWQVVKDIMKVNFFGLVNCLEAAMPLLINASAPHIVGIGSQATQAPFPQAEAYGSSKAAVRYFLESLRMDMKQVNIDVSIILPGFVNTPLTQKNTFDMPFIMEVEPAVKRIVKAIKKRTWLYAFPKRLSAILWLARHYPKLWLAINSDKTLQKGD